MITQEAPARAELKALQAAWRALRADWQLSDREVRELLPKGGETTDAPPADTELRMRILVEIRYRMPANIEDVFDWLRFGTPALGWSTPLDAMSMGLPELRHVRRAVESGTL